ncbi:coiled-coil domain-containing protein [Micromonospora sp. NPDC003241]
MTAPLRRWMTPVVAVFAAFAVFAGPLPAMAAPNPPAPAEHDDDPPMLNDLIESANRDFSKAKNQLEKSKKRQLKLDVELRRAQADLDALRPQVAEIATQSYRTGRVGAIAMLLQSNAPDSFMDRASALDELNLFNDKKLGEVNTIRERADQAKLASDAEVREQQKLTNDMARKKTEAEKSLRLVGGEGLTGGLVAATSPVARVAPNRASDGSWKPESCSQKDPTTSGCITPRTLHMYKEVKRAGFDRFVGCWRPGDRFEHPKGRACDWSLQNSGFSPWHNNDTRIYGNNLAAFLVRNADRLGIYYVIWNRQIWFPTENRWRSYSGPSNHTDHVHVSLL